MKAGSYDWALSPEFLTQEDWVGNFSMIPGQCFDLSLKISFLNVALCVWVSWSQLRLFTSLVTRQESGFVDLV